MSSELERLVLTMESLKREVGHLKSENAQYLRGIEELEKQLKEKDREIGELKSQGATLQAENAAWAREFEKLRKHLRKYENENTPSGSIPPYLKPEAEEKLPKERSQPEGKSANTRNSREKKPDGKEIHELEACPHCGGEVRKMKAKPNRRTVIHLVMPSTEVIEHILPRYFCHSCNKEVAPRVKDTLPNSKFDLSTILLISYFSVALNLSDGKIKELFWELFGLKLSRASVCNARVRLREHLGPYYRGLEKKLKRARVLYKDETGWRKNGKTHWVWVVVTLKTAYFAIEAHRNAEVAKQLKMRKDAKQVCDGFGAYNGLATTQRCWAHLSGKARRPEHFFSNEKENCDYSEVVGRLGTLFADAKEERKAGCSKELKEKYEGKLLALLENAMRPNRNLDALTRYVKNYPGEWFTFLEHPEVEPTNNRAERAMRHIVLKRRISQQSRSQFHMESYERQVSAYMTARLNSQSYLELLRNVVGERIADVGKS